MQSLENEEIYFWARVVEKFAEWGFEMEDVDVLIKTPCEKVCQICNGIGPEWFPPALRKLIDMMHPTLFYISVLHDLWYYYGDGSQRDFHNANIRFIEFGLKAANAEYGWYNPLRYHVRHKARQFGILCEKFGWSAYCAAIKQRKEHEAIL